jgi:mannose-6-phosphate isomerase-like protein (cupin superfamily)
MIRKISQTQTDSDELSMRQQSSLPPASKFDYRGIVVNKPWGYEYLLYENDQVAIWVLYLKNGAQTSMHCHPKKKTSLFVLDGAVKTSSLCDSHALGCRDCVMIDKATFHSTASDSDDGAFIMEIETPPEKTDLVRLKDEYGRENKGYEAGKELSHDTTGYEYHDFHHDIEDERKVIEKVIKNSRVVLHNREVWQSFKDEVAQKHFCTISFLDVDLLNDKGEVVLPLGDICEGEWFLEQYDKLRPTKDVFTVLTIH